MQAGRILALLGGLLFAFGSADAADAPKRGGILKIYHRDSPASMSIHEEATWSTIMPMGGVFNNLVIYDQHIKQNSLADHPPRARRKLGLGRGWQGPHLQAAPRRQMA